MPFFFYVRFLRYGALPQAHCYFLLAQKVAQKGRPVKISGRLTRSASGKFQQTRSDRPQTRWNF